MSEMIYRQSELMFSKEDEPEWLLDLDEGNLVAEDLVSAFEEGQLLYEAGVSAQSL
jgi:hypothetical protein